MAISRLWLVELKTAHRATAGFAQTSKKQGIEVLYYEEHEDKEIHKTLAINRLNNTR